ncbi:MAG: ATP-binding cassette domain-containing protein [Clostridiales bacterium]|jgi:putative ABC transport system ATP-binding protein|nr:ATP-binding cassette domain-containing protein [Eubacteriales bacterium]MDH7566690.1 ATP-binding cassette domain-containing protein [Clostridiales bacterium]
MTLLEAIDLYRFYHTEDEETLALRGVSMGVKAGEIVAVMGPSGSGKSTLLSCLSGIDEPDGGYVAILGKRLSRKPEAYRASVRATDIGIMLQSGTLFNGLSIYDNILLKMQLARKVDRKRAMQLIEAVGLSHKAHAYPAGISGGEAARAAIAVALSTNPKILLADEPTGEVDAETERQIIRLFEQYCRDGGAAVIATHSGSLASHADRVVYLRDGRVVDEC